VFLVGLARTQSIQIRMPEILPLLTSLDIAPNDVPTFTQPDDPTRIVDHYDEAWWESEVPSGLEWEDIYTLWNRHRDVHLQQVSLITDQ
jgi:hypothetical protein